MYRETCGTWCPSLCHPSVTKRSTRSPVRAPRAPSSRAPRGWTLDTTFPRPLIRASHPGTGPGTRMLRTELPPSIGQCGIAQVTADRVALEHLGSARRWGESALGPTNRRGPSDVRGTRMGADLLFQELGDPATSDKLPRGLPLWGTTHGGPAMRQPVGDCFQRGCMNNRPSRMCRARRGLGWHGRSFPARADSLFEKPASHGCLYAMSKKQGSKQRDEYRVSTW